MATKAIIGKSSLCVVRRIGEDLRIGRAVRARMPRSVFVLMAVPASRCQGKHIHIAQVNYIWRPPDYVYANVPQLRSQTRIMTVHTSGGPMRRRVDGAGKGCHLVATRAALSVLRGVVVRGTVHQRN